jgi:MerR family copper efflux transcriptional regulator
MAKKACTVGALARILNVSADTVRHYERIGLLPRAERSQSGYRVWDGNKLEYLIWVGPAKRAGFTLRQLANIFQMYRAGNSSLPDGQGYPETKSDRY